MLPPHLRKVSDLYDSYGLGAVKNIWLLACLVPLARTVYLYKMKDYVRGVLDKESTQPQSHYKRLIRFFQDWGDRKELLHDLQGMTNISAKVGLNSSKRTRYILQSGFA